MALHAQHAGFPLAEPIVLVTGPLCVVDGGVCVDGYVSVVDKKPGKVLAVHSVFAAVTSNTEVAWTKTPPSLDAAWSVEPFYSIVDSPCLFVKK